MTQPIIDIRNLTIRFGAITVVKNVDLQIWPGESVALVGESGSGKTLTARSLLGLQPENATVTADRFVIAGRDMQKVKARQWRAIRGRSIGYVLQDALISLDPLRRIGQQLSDALSAVGAVPRAELHQQSIALLRAAGIADAESRLALYPHQLSGGQRQRALIATALAGNPQLLIADEPTTALDMTVQRQILQLLAQRQRDGHALLLISHDLAVVAELADRVLVMRDGEVVEQGATRSLLQSPQHHWTQRLLRAVPTPQTRGTRLAGAQPLPPKVISPGPPLLQALNVNKAWGERQVLNNINFTLNAGETLGVVGESGSGKTSLVKVVMGLTEPDSGSLLLEGQPWNNLTESARRPRRARLQLIAQDPFSSFDPRYTVEKIIGESLDSVGIFGDARRQRVRQLLDEVQLGDRFLTRYPRELSGGQRQRVAIARAFAPNPALLVADEPVSALDVSVQAQVLDLLADMQAQHGTALLFISHDLGVIQHLADRVLVMQNGHVVESGATDQVFRAPQHPWTQKLLQALPVLPQQVA